jgi:PTH2 family peptidyl-tRNA hydrolase
MKQVIIIRKDLKMRRGKEIAQGSHASMAFLIRKMESFGGLWEFDISPSTINENYIPIKDDITKWISGGQTKITLQIHSEKELMDLFEVASARGLRSHYITDAGRTEFKGVPTITALAIGPNESEEIDKITGHLKLY